MSGELEENEILAMSDDDIVAMSSAPPVKPEEQLS